MNIDKYPMTNQAIHLKTEDGDLVAITPTGVVKTTKDGIVSQIITKGKWTVFETHCPLCDGHHGCDNCYYGQIDSKEPNEHCEDCEHNSDKVPTEWTPLGDTYCRKCGRYLRT